MSASRSRRCRRSLLTAIPGLLLAAAGFTSHAEAGDPSGAVDLPRYPAISPDGRQITFTWRGDLWLVPAGGGHATRLTSHPGNDVHSAWSPDGATIAFSSDRTGYLNVHLMNADGTGIRHLTDLDQACFPSGFGTDERGAAVVLLHASIEGDVYRDFRPYAVSNEGGDLRRLHDAFGSQPALGPDGNRIAFVRGGYYDRGASRRHYRGAEASDVWTWDRASGAFDRLTAWEGNDRLPRWGGARTLLYLSDRELDCVNLYRMSATDGERTSARLTGFTKRDVQHFDVSADGRTVVLAVWDTLYALDLDDPGAKPVPLVITASTDERDGHELKSIDRTVTEAALSPDGKVMAVVAYGEVYVRHVDEGSPTRRVTTDHAREKDIAWSPDGRRLYFTSDRDGTESIYAAAVALTRDEVLDRFAEQTGAEEDEPDEDEEAKGEDTDEDEDEDEEEEAELPPALRPERWHDAIDFEIEPVVQRPSSDRAAYPAPDGRRLAFRGVLGDLNVIDLETGAIDRLVEGWDYTTTLRWSPDSRHIAYTQADLDFNTDVFIVAADGSGRPVNISRHPDDDTAPRFSADGKVLTFLSQRINDQNDVWAVYLDRDLETLTAHERSKYYEERLEAVKKRKPLKVRDPAAEDDDEEADDEADGAEPLDLDDAYLRLRRITSMPENEIALEITPAGDRFIFATEGPDAAVYSVKWDGTDRQRLAGDAGVQHVDLTGEKVVLVAGNRAATVAPGGGALEHVDVKDRIRIDLAEQSSQKFREAARGLGEGYYDPTMNGLDWPTVSADYHELARRARTAEEFNWVANRLIGELNGSHLRISASDPASPNRQQYGRLGTVDRRVADGFEVTAVVPFSPAATGTMALAPGDVITAIEGRPFGPTETVASALKDRIGRETLLALRRTGPDGAALDLDVLIKPIGFREERQLKYRAWRRENARLVDAWSNGRLGYIHIQGMSQPSLDVFERDLFAAANGKDGLIIDVRNNGGGWTTDRVLSSIMVQPHAWTTPRGADPARTGHYPQPRLFIQRYTLPMNLLCNEKSYSNAEIMSHAFKTLRRGTLVGQQTHGSVISTGGWSLIDGTWVRLPFRGWYLMDGTDMELHGAMPDRLVPQTPDAETRGDDEQLKAAVDDLLGRLRR